MATEAAVLVFDRRSVRAVDRESVEQYGVPGIVLMENAARGIAEIAVGIAGDPVVICCGPGNNGGDGYAVARHLANRGRSVVLVAAGDPRPGGDADTNRRICAAMDIPIAVNHPPTPGLVVDALLGTGLDRPPAGAAAAWIDWINDQAAPVLAVDVPSGLDCDSGAPLDRAVRADHTATMVGWKRGFLAEGSRAWTGEVTVVDIGAPRVLVERYGRPMSAA